MKELGILVDLRINPEYGHDYHAEEYLNQTLNFFDRVHARAISGKAGKCGETVAQVIGCPDQARGLPGLSQDWSSPFRLAT